MEGTAKEVKPTMFVQSKREIIQYGDKLYVREEAYFPKWFYYSKNTAAARRIAWPEIDSESERYSELENHYQNGEVLR